MNLIVLLLFSFLYIKVTQTCVLKSLILSTGFIISTSTHLAFFQDDSDDNDLMESGMDVPYDGKEAQNMIDSRKEDEASALKKYQNQCILQTGVSPCVLKRLLDGAWHIEDILVKKWTLCVLNKLGLMSAEGVFRLDVAWTKVAEKDKGEAEKLINSCVKALRPNAEPHDFAWQYLKCHHAHENTTRFKSLGINE